MIVFSGDLVAYWKPGVEDLVLEALEPLLDFSGSSLAVPGNHDYFAGDAEFLRPILSLFGTRLLRNECWHRDGVNWVGVDSASMHKSDPEVAFSGQSPDLPTLVVWHEPDMADSLSEGPVLMLAGHSHGGQFRTPWGWAPMKTELGSKYIEGLYQEPPVPVYVSRGLGTTGPPSRLFCTPEVTVLTLLSDQ